MAALIKSLQMEAAWLFKRLFLNVIRRPLQGCSQERGEGPHVYAVDIRWKWTWNSSTSTMQGKLLMSWPIMGGNQGWERLTHSPGLVPFPAPWDPQVKGCQRTLSMEIVILDFSPPDKYEFFLGILDRASPSLYIISAYKLGKPLGLF